MSNKQLIGQRLSFYDLFHNDNFVIQIPTIQRDYAQGRENKSELRDLFLHALYEYLEENIPFRDLDFIYGSVEVVEGVNTFIPLDGQQRLTTLFLLHWYLSVRSGNSDSFRDLMLKNNKSRFTYLTRPSSSEFLDAFLQHEIDLDNLISTSNGQNNELSKTIMDKGWYYLSWSHDPTIQSMLLMLDSIHVKFNMRKEFYARLINLQHPIITFQYLDLKEFKLTEDLYIKMNSRGKSLTSFENFKAKLEQHIDLTFGILKKPFLISDDKIEATYREYFSFQIDTSWAKLFWQYRTLIGKPTTFDEEIMNFMRVVIANQYTIENGLNLTALKELVKNESATAELTEDISFFKFKSLNALTQNCINYLINAFDSLTNDNQKIKCHLNSQKYYNENEIFEKALKYTISLPERVILHAYLRFLIVNKSNKTNFSQWMRVIHNLVENSRIEDVEQLVSAIKSIENLLESSEDILNYLTGNNCKITFFPEIQVEEEKLKALLILKSPEWKNQIEKHETESFHKGQIAYIFEFSGILEYYRKHGSFNWEENENNMYFDSFCSYAIKSEAFFSIYYAKENDTYLIERSLLTKGNYLIPASQNKFNFCSSKNVSNYQRDFSWKRLLRISENESLDWKNRRLFVKELLDDEKFNPLDIPNSLSKICENIPSDWRAYFIKNFDLIDYCQQGYIYMKNEYIELFKESQMNHYHIDMYVYNLYLLYFYDKINKFEPFENCKLVEQKNAEDYSCLTLEDFTFNAKRYELSIYWYEDNYVIEFKKSKGNIKQVDYNKEIIEIVEQNKLIWDEETELFKITKRTENSTFEFIKKLCQEFKIIK